MNSLQHILSQHFFRVCTSVPGFYHPGTSTPFLRGEVDEQDLVKLARADEETWDVDRVLAHRGSKRNGDLYFLVTWKELAPEETTWIPWYDKEQKIDNRRVAPLRAYVSKHCL